MKHTKKFLVLLLAIALLLPVFANNVEAATPDNHLTATAAGGVTTFKVSKGAAVTLKVEANADDMDGITYTWELQSYYNSESHSWSTVSESYGASESDTYVVSSATRAENYRVRVDDAYGNYVYVAFTIQIQNNFQVYAQVDVNDFVVLAGDTAELEVKAYGKDLDQIKYKWYRISYKGSGAYQTTTISSATGPTYTAPVRDAGAAYYCIATDKYGNTSRCGANPGDFKQPDEYYVGYAGDSVTMSVGFIEDDVESYTWQVCKNPKGYASTWVWTDVSQNKYPSAATDSLTFQLKQSMEGYRYRCVVERSVGTFTSDATRLYLLGFVGGVTGATELYEDDTASLRVDVLYIEYDDGTIYQDGALQWQVSKDGGSTWSNISKAKFPSAIEPTLVFTSKLTMDGYQYRCRLTITDGRKFYTDPVTLSVQPKYGFELQPKDTATFTGSTAAFSITPINADEVKTYQWQVSKDGGVTWKNIGTSYTSAKTANLSFAGKATMDGYQYRCKVTYNDKKVIYSDPATLSVKYFTAEATDCTASAGKSATFFIETSYPVTSYRWQVSKDGGATWKNVSQTSYPSAATATLSFTTKASMQGYQYRCIVTYADGTTDTSTPATLTVK